MIPPLLPKTLSEQLHSHILLLTRKKLLVGRLGFEDREKLLKWAQKVKELIDIFMGEQDRLINEYIKLNRDLLNTRPPKILVRKKK